MTKQDWTECHGTLFEKHWDDYLA